MSASRQVGAQVRAAMDSIPAARRIADGAWGNRAELFALVREMEPQALAALDRADSAIEAARASGDEIGLRRARVAYHSVMGVALGVARAVSTVCERFAF